MTRRIPEKESLTVEFKSDQQRLPDRELVSTAMSLANTNGGDIYLGVEDNGTVTGLHPRHQYLSGLAALIANRTNPPLGVRVEVIDIDDTRIARITVPRSRQIVSTSDGLTQRRRLMADGTPQSVPLYPHEFLQRQSDLGLLDYSALPVAGASLQDFDPLELERLRQMIHSYNGDQALLELSDQELEGALGLIQQEGTERMPTVAGLLVLGRESAMRQLLPTHEVAFQVLNGTQVRVNDFYRTPLLKTFERVMEQFKARVEEDEILMELFRVPIPNYDVHAVREALVNALTHRDYTRLGTVYIRLESTGLVVSNPGGFVEGVTVNNLLVIDPKPRNPRLADIFKRIGLAERTGRGVDRIYEGLLRYGRPQPDYSRSDRVTVAVQLKNVPADVPFFQMILEEEKRLGSRLPVDSLIILARLREEKQVDIITLASAIQKSDTDTISIVEHLIETGLIETHGSKKGRTYSLTAKVYPQLVQSAPYVRETGFESFPIHQDQRILEYVQQHGKITRKDAINLCRVNKDQASYLLRSLSKSGKLALLGKGRGAFYTLP